MHHWSGALGALLALDYPQRVAGLVIMLVLVAYPWPGGVGWYNKVVTTPAIGRLLAYTITLPLGFFRKARAPARFCRRSCRKISWRNTATPLLLRPREFLANARDLVTLEAAVAEQAPRYPDIACRGDFRRRRQDGVDEHSLPGALQPPCPMRKLIVLPEVGHMVRMRPDS